MSVQELMQKHVKEKCEGCKNKNCGGIHITRDNKTRCDKNE